MTELSDGAIYQIVSDQLQLKKMDQLKADNAKLRLALQNIMGWIDGSDNYEQIPPLYLTAAYEALK